MLEPLLAVLHIPDDDIASIKSLHASLFDFLLDRNRSGDLFLDLSPAHLSIMQYYILIEAFDEVSPSNSPECKDVLLVLHSPF